jgi:exosome complex RNA-binding protein Rrp4
MEDQVSMADIVKAVVQWVIVPVAGFVWLIYKTQQQHQTEIAVLKAVHEANKEAHDREFKELRESFKTVFTKLDTIEQALRS